VNKSIAGMLGLAMLAGSGGCQMSGPASQSPSAARAASGDDQAVASSAAAPRGGDVDLTIFFRELAPRGGWVDHKDLGPIWFPYETLAGWRPFLNGRWVATDGGEMLWAGGENFSWATDHYGRWMFLDNLGWVWTPGRTWSSANVEWRRGDGYVGWAPMTQEKSADATPTTSPESAMPDAMLATTTTAASTTTTASTTAATGATAPVAVVNHPPTAFTFVKEASLFDEKLRGKAELVTSNITLLDRTRPATAKEIVESLGDAASMKRKVVDRKDAGVTDVRETEVAIYRPAIGPRPESSPAIPILTRLQTPLAGEEQRQRQAEYFDQLRDVLDERQEREQKETKSDPDLAKLTARQRREREVLAEYRQREVEALRRRQREARELFAAQEARAKIARENQPPAKPALIPIPPEWELPPGMMRRD
jgi:hypothetical protein